MSDSDKALFCGVFVQIFNIGLFGVPLDHTYSGPYGFRHLHTVQCRAMPSHVTPRHPTPLLLRCAMLHDAR